MNDPNKVINVNLSSLLSLKAELLRKQAEVNKVKGTKVSLEEYEAHKVSRVERTLNGESKPTTKLKKKQKHLEEVDKNDNSIVYEHEDNALIEKSHRILVAKSKYYERMSKSGGTLNSDDNCLVMFNKKRQQCQNTSDAISNKTDESECDSESDSEDGDNDDDEPVPSDDEWVEYTDCLGRTRKCLRKDLLANKKRDAELAATMPERLDQTKANWMIDTLGAKEKHNDDTDSNIVGPTVSQSVFGDGLSIMSKHEEQKVNWERKEQENLEKTDVHYQDVFFDEARQHGVGYYAFSTDEEERQRQQRELEKARLETLEEQEKREAMRKQRENIIAERVWAAKNRQRARLGLPPLDKSEMLKQSEEAETPKETKKERKARRKAEKLAKIREQKEKELENERQQYIRPWDLQKKGTHATLLKNGEQSEDSEEWIYKPEREPMTQEQWNEYKRSERIEEFAPLPENQLKRTHFTAVSSSSSSTLPSSKPSSSTLTDYNSSTENADIHYDAFVSYQSTKRQQNPVKTFKRRNYDAEDNKGERKGAAIPPPPNLDCTNNNSFQAKKSKSSYELERSIEAGLRFLRNSYDKQTSKTKTTWTANAEY